jgi:hypothetical protein
MKIKKDTILKINHTRKGLFYASAMRDFDTEKEEFYPVRVAQNKTVKGMNTDWEVGEEIPYRNTLCKIEIAK